MNSAASSFLDTITVWGLEAFFYLLRHIKEILGGAITLGGLIFAALVVLSILGWLFGGRNEIVPPAPSGNFGTQDVAWRDSELSATGLIGAPWGHGIRCGYSWEGAVNGDGTKTVLRYCGENSLIGFGPPGAGKGTDFQIPAIIEFGSVGNGAGDGNDSGEAGGSMIVVDPSGQLTACTIEEVRKRARVIVLAPFTEGLPPGLPELIGPSRGYNPLPILLDPKSQSFESNAALIAELVIPDDTGRQSSESRFFTGRARGLGAGVMMQLMLNYPPEQQNLAEVCRIIMGRKIFAFARTAMLQPGNRFVKDRLAPYARIDAPGDKTINSILGTADNGLEFLSDRAISRVVRISSLRFADLKIGPRPTVVYIVLPVSRLDSSGWFRMLVGAGLMELNATPRGTWPVMVMVDEAALCGKLSLIQRAYAESRKRGVQLYCWFQNTNQAASIYGDPDWKNMLSGSDIQLILPPRDLSTARLASELGGKKSVVTHNYSYSEDMHAANGYRSNLGFGEVGRDVYTPHEVMALGRHAALLFAPSLSKNILHIYRAPYWEDRELKKRVGVDPYHRHKNSR